MFFTSIGCAVFAIVAAALSITTNGPLAELWAIAMVGALALGTGSLVGLWASDEDFDFDWQATLKTLLGVGAAAFAAPVMLVAFALFLLAMLPCAVLMLPIIATWDIGMAEPEKRPPALMPRHA